MRILISGATGLVGSQITQLCKEKGIAVNYLTTSKEKIKDQPQNQGFFGIQQLERSMRPVLKMLMPSFIWQVQV
mgnify:CR=1 FL=1